MNNVDKFIIQFYHFFNDWLLVILFLPSVLSVIYYDIKYPDRNTIIVDILSFLAGGLIWLIIEYMRSLR